MIQDPGDELFTAVRRSGDDPSAADRQAVALIQRRFGLALPPPFAERPRAGEPVPVRVATAADAAAVASVRWRSWQVAYEGLLPADVLATIPTRPPLATWVSAATVPPSTRHAMLVAGRPGVVLGMTQLRPTRDPDQDPAEVTEIDTLYLDPLVLRQGIGRALLDAAVAHALSSGASRLSLWVVQENTPARAFYASAGWRTDGMTSRFDLGDGVGMDEVRYWLTPDGATADAGTADV